MKKILYVIIGLSLNMGFAQTGVNTDDPKATLHVVEDVTDPSIAVGVIAPLLTGNQLKAKDNLYQTEHTGAIVYVTEIPSTASTKTTLVTSPGYYYFDGEIWKRFEADKQSEDDATRFLGGTVYVYKDNNIPSGDTILENQYVIGGSNGQTYQIGTLTQTSSKGGIRSIIGNGYTISNTSNGIFDIEFDLPLDEIYGISVNIYDNYASGGSIPLYDTPGNNLNTNDNSQVAFISNTIIRIKTGNQNGQLANRSFTFLVTGK